MLFDISEVGKDELLTLLDWDDDFCFLEVGEALSSLLGSLFFESDDLMGRSPSSSCCESSASCNNISLTDGLLTVVSVDFVVCFVFLSLIFLTLLVIVMKNIKIKSI
jgi:tetrahydromethanopterin S-methyltransferase subunit B